MYINYSLNQIGNNYIVYNKVDKNHYEIGYVDYKILQYFQKGLSKRIFVKSSQLIKMSSKRIRCNCLRWAFCRMFL